MAAALQWLRGTKRHKSTCKSEPDLNQTSLSLTMIEKYCASNTLHNVTLSNTPIIHDVPRRRSFQSLRSIIVRSWNHFIPHRNENNSSSKGAPGVDSLPTRQQRQSVPCTTLLLIHQPTPESSVTDTSTTSHNVLSVASSRCSLESSESLHYHFNAIDLSSSLASLELKSGTALSLHSPGAGIHNVAKSGVFHDAENSLVKPDSGLGSNVIVEGEYEVPLIGEEIASQNENVNEKNKNLSGKGINVHDSKSSQIQETFYAKPCQLSHPANESIPTFNARRMSLENGMTKSLSSSLTTGQLPLPIPSIDSSTNMSSHFNDFDKSPQSVKPGLIYDEAWDLKMNRQLGLTLHDLMPRSSSSYSANPQSSHPEGYRTRAMSSSSKPSGATENASRYSASLTNKPFSVRGNQVVVPTHSVTFAPASTVIPSQQCSAIQRNNFQNTSSFVPPNSMLPSSHHPKLNRAAFEYVESVCENDPTPKGRSISLISSGTAPLRPPRKPISSTLSYSCQCAFMETMPLQRQRWYNPTISRLHAQQYLLRTSDCNFLVRDGSTFMHEYALTLRCEKNFFNLRISQTEDGLYVIGKHSQPFVSVSSLIHYYTHVPLPIFNSDSVLLQCRIPLPHGAIATGIMVPRQTISNSGDTSEVLMKHAPVMQGV